MLDCRRVSKAFGGTLALQEIDLTVARGEIVGLIGPNGSGKSTLVNVVSGFYHPDAGEVYVDGDDVSRARPQRLRRMGLVRTFQNLRSFDNLTVMENTLLGMHPEYTAGRSGTRVWLRALFQPPSVRRIDERLRERAIRMLELMDLERVADVRVENLSYGLKKRVDMARALVGEPSLLLLDEPAAGLSTTEVQAILNILSGYESSKRPGILLIEHRLELVMSVSQRVVVLDAGRKLAEGTPREIATNDDVIRAYIGGGGSHE